MQVTWVRSLGREDPLEKEMATYFQEPGMLQSMGSQRVSIHAYEGAGVSIATSSQLTSEGHIWVRCFTLALGVLQS